MTDHRPSRRLKAQRSAAAKAAEGAPIVVMEIDGERFEVRPGLWTWRDEQELYNLTSLGWPRLLAELQAGNPSPFILGCLVFLVLRGRGEQVTLDDAQAVTAGNPDFELNPPDPDPDDESASVPEDQGSDGGPTSQP